jgi:RNA polymerase sigma-70 factor, ECF subfamily
VAAPNTRGLDELSDSALVVAIARWQQDALAEAYRRHAGPVYGLAYRVLRDPALAEEAAREVFLRLWTRPEHFDAERGRLRTFLLTLAHGRAVDVVRADTSRRRRGERTALEPTAGGLGADREVWGQEVAGQVRAAIFGLPDNQRQAIELTYFDGQTCREVAVALGKPEGAVKSGLRAGLRRTRDELTSAGVEL